MMRQQLDSIGHRHCLSGKLRIRLQQQPRLQQVTRRSTPHLGAAATLFPGFVTPIFLLLPGRMSRTHTQLWYKKPPAGSDPYYQNHLLDFDGAWNS
jgi:hypothetical protein